MLAVSVAEVQWWWGGGGASPTLAYSLPALGLWTALGLHCVPWAMGRGSIILYRQVFRVAQTCRSEPNSVCAVRHDAGMGGEEG